MTIAACYLSLDGVVFGADSTTTMFVQGLGPNPGGTERHYNYAQKIFQIGDQSTLGLTMWGLGNLQNVSYRTLIGQLGDDLATNPPQSVDEVANRWNAQFWKAFSTDFAPLLQLVQELRAKNQRTLDEEQELNYFMNTLTGGFCLGGNLPNDRTPKAFEILYNPSQTAPGPIEPLNMGSTRFWGCPNIINRLLYGVDFQVLDAIQNSGKWTGTNDELIALILPHCLGQPVHLPIREAVDWVYASIYTTIKTMKFSHLAPVCGGPVEVAVITTDRPFRWVRHKRMDEAITQRGFSDE